jgi:hypothetical protein
MEWAIQLFAAGLKGAFEEAKTAVIEAGVHRSEGPELFPWLPWVDRNVQVHLGSDYLTHALDLTRTLTGQKVKAGKATAATITLQSAIWLQARSKVTPYVIAYGVFENPAQPLFTLELASLVVESATFEGGSAKGKLLAKLRILVVSLPLIGGQAGPWVGPVVVAPMLGAAATPIVEHIYKEHLFKQEIEVDMAGQPCKVYATWKYDPETMRQHNLEAFNFEAPGLSDIERRMRTCNAQLAMKIAQGSPDKIDAVWGKGSEAALVAFAKKHGLPPDIKNEALRGVMHEVFWNRPPK